MEEIDPDNKQALSLQTMVEIWRITVLEDDDFLSATQNFVGLYTRKLNIHFAPSNFSFVFGNLKMN